VGLNPSPEFHLLRVEDADVPVDHSVRLSDIVLPGADLVVVMNYMIDVQWLFQVCPSWGSPGSSKVVLVHGNPTVLDCANREVLRDLPHVRQVRPRLPNPVGVHHSKVLLLFYGSRGVRICILTANMIAQDWSRKTQGAFIRDFPRKLEFSTNEGSSEFEQDFVEYVSAVFGTTDRDKELGLEVTSRIQEYDYQNSGVVLLPSVPGSHSRKDKNRFGHMKLRRALSREVFAQPQSARVICQFSSIGAVREYWLGGEFAQSLFQGGNTWNEGAEAVQSPELVYPTVRQVGESREGWEGGNSLPVSSENILRREVRNRLYRYDADLSGRQALIPHIKTYVRYCPGRSDPVDWVILTSANLSIAAWGRLQSGGLLKIFSFELGVLILPGRFLPPQHSIGNPLWVGPPMFQGLKVILVPYWSNSPDDRETEAPGYQVTFPLPYALPPRRYGPEDIPWYIDGEFRVPGLPPYPR